VRLIGAFKVEKNGKRNDRYVGCLLPSKETSLSTDGYASLKDLPEQLLQEMETFLQMYSVQKGNDVRVIGRMGPNRSIEAVKSAAS
jgi:inorganic pyrophosphatase